MTYQSFIVEQSLVLTIWFFKGFNIGMTTFMIYYKTMEWFDLQIYFIQIVLENK